MTDTRDIESREDIVLLVDTFYGKIRQDTLLGHIFNTAIDHWPEHLSKLADFWETNLLHVQKFKGNPMKTHIDVDQQFDHAITQKHFDHWLDLWYETVNELFVGAKAILAKDRARNIANITFLRIYQARLMK